MRNTRTADPHSFHIPVMGTGFMVDAPLNAARYGISSVISLVDDVLIEQMRKFHCEKAGEPYEAIPTSDEDARARRITAYLNLIDRLIHRQVEQLQAAPFEEHSDITRYFRLLPESPLSEEYRQMLAATDPEDRRRRQEQLRRAAVPGRIDVNIMSKVDRDRYRNGQKLPPEFGDALAALRGFAQSTLRSAIVFSAGINPRLYTYAAEFPDFFPDENGELKKTIILKVSDFHSALVQGKFLTKRGLWVSEFRIESGLNCGGHAFATKGELLGPILEEFQREKQRLIGDLHTLYAKALAQRGQTVREPYPLRVTVQGGIGTAEEDRLLREHYGVDGTGWGTPFLLVPEVTSVDDEHLRLLCEATEKDVWLSDSSPFGMPFWNLRTSASEVARRRRIAEDRPGSICSKGYAKLFNTEFTDTPICTASRQYQAAKLAWLSQQELDEEQRDAMRESVLAKSCICHDLAGGATLRAGVDPAALPAICCGPNIVNFSRIATLEEMVGHIYGRCSLLTNPNRPHMFLRELALNIDFLRNEHAKRRVGLSSHAPSYFQEFIQGLVTGVSHYRRLAEQFTGTERQRFEEELERLDRDVQALSVAKSAPRPR